MSDMGTFRIDVEVGNPLRLTQRTMLHSVPVDPGAELSWFPASVLEALGVERRKLWHFRQANGSQLDRWAGWAVVHVGDLQTIDEVVFGEPGDLTLLGARSLEGLNVRIDPVSKVLVDAGPAPAASAVAVDAESLLTRWRELPQVEWERLRDDLDGTFNAEIEGLQPVSVGALHQD